jgi:transcriptional regulator
MRFDRELLKGTTETVLLAVLSEQPLHGYELARRLRARTDGVFELGEGTLYPLLYKLEDKGLIKGKWESGDGQRRRRVYRITARGRRNLAARTEQWQALARGMALALQGVAYG